MKINFNTNNNFYGYKNVIANSIATDEGELSYIAVQLDNEGAHKDLDKFVSLKKMLNQNCSINDNILVFSYSKDVKMNADSMFFEGEALDSANRLLYQKTKMTEKDFKIHESTNLKIFTFLANITKRISLDQHVGVCNAYNFQLLMSKLLDILKYNLADEESVLNFVLLSAKPNTTPQQVGRRFYKKIHNNMIKYFKCYY